MRRAILVAVFATIALTGCGVSTVTHTVTSAERATVTMPSPTTSEYSMLLLRALNNHGNVREGEGYQLTLCALNNIKREVPHNVVAAAEPKIAMGDPPSWLT